MVINTYTIIYPRTMMIESFNTLMTDTTMTTSLSSFYFALWT